jgi:hypothetical protein
LLRKKKVSLDAAIPRRSVCKPQPNAAMELQRASVRRPYQHAVAFPEVPMTARRLVLASFLFSMVAVSPAAAAPIIVCNTGQLVGCTGTVADGLVDPNYVVTQAPLPTLAGAATVVIPDGFPLPGSWIANGADSKWIGPTPNDADSNGAIGNYTYRTTFLLTDLNPATASITGSWATDNNGVDILINGVSTGQTTCFACFGVLTPFSINSGFVIGLNTLDFVLTNGGGPTGLRVDDISGTANPLGTSVPEPTSLLLLAIGLAAARAGRNRQALRPVHD